MLPDYKKQEPGLYVKGESAIAGYRFTYPGGKSIVMGFIRKVRSGQIDIQTPGLAKKIALAEPELVDRILKEVEHDGYSAGDYAKIAHYSRRKDATSSLGLAKMLTLVKDAVEANWCVHARVSDGRISENISDLNKRFKEVDTKILEQLCAYDLTELPDFTPHIVGSEHSRINYQLDKLLYNLALEDVEEPREEDDVQEPCEEKPCVILPFKRD